MSTTTASTDELTTLREDAAFVEHGLRFLVRTSGADVRDWLERIVSNPVAALPPGRCVRATLMDGKGKLRADLRVLSPPPSGEPLLLDLPASHREQLLRLLDLYVIKDDVQLTDLSDERAVVSLLGPRAAEVLDEAGLPAPGKGEVADAEGVLLATSRLGGVPGFDLLASASELKALRSRLVGAGAGSAGLAALDVVRLQHGVAWFGPDLAAGVIPLEALMEPWVSITKGCYPGQEVVARIQNLGQVARKLVRLRGDDLAAAPDPGELLGTGEQDGKAAGILTSAARDPASGTVWAVGFARRAFWKSGTRVRLGASAFVVESLSGD